MNVRIAFAVALAVATPAAFAAPDAQNRPTPIAQLDKNGDGQISRDEAQASPRLSQSFDRLDTNKDGQLSREELKAARGAGGAGHAGQMSQLDTNKDGMISRDEAKASPRLSQSFDSLDTNKDGQLSADELRAARVRGQGQHAKLDTNHDGTISRDEATGAPSLARNFDAIDTNKDGQLSRDEIAAWRRAHTHQAQAAPKN